MACLSANIKQTALANLDRQAMKFSAAGNSRKTFVLGEHSFTIAEIKKEIIDETDRGCDFARIWARPEEDILNEIRKAQALRTKARL